MEDESEFRSEIAKIDNELELIQQNIEELLTRQEELSNRKQYLQEQLNENELLSQTKGKDWSLTNFEWSREIEDLRKNVFHIEQFRPLQLECMNVTMAGVDCILIMPTGGGKSLTFQLPALVSPGFTLVISPLISLMEDQLMSLQEYNINACLLNAASSKEHVNKVHSDMIRKDSGLKILYVTPEKIAKSKRFMAKLQKAYKAGCLSRIVIDEVHCTSQWGNDFRPDYKILGILKRQFPNSPILGLTATATSRVIQDVKKILNLKSNCVLLKASFNRPNLYYEIRKKPSTAEAILDELASVIKMHFSGESGIVYCFSKKDSADVAAGLCSRQISAHCYHADLASESRTKIHHAWTKGEVKVIVATVAFGMGIDKPNVRFVIHHTMSKSMENYYQESGRAGRDGNNAHCILYYNPADSSRQSCMVFTEQTGLENLYKMLSYCQDLQSCRRSLIGQYFGEEWKDEECQGMCDNCHRLRNGHCVPVKKCLTNEAQSVVKILENAQKIAERVTMIKLLDAWQGKGSKKLRVNNLPVPAITLDNCQRFVIHLLLDNILKEDFHFTPFSTISYLVPGPRAPNALGGEISVTMALSADTTTQKSSIIFQKGVSRKRNISKGSASDVKMCTESKGKKAKMKVDIAECGGHSQETRRVSSKSTDKIVVID